MHATKQKKPDPALQEFAEKNGAGGRMLIAGLAAVHGEKPEDRAWAARYCDVMERLRKALQHAAMEEGYARHTKQPRYDLRRTTITVHPRRGPADDGSRREISVELGRGVELSPADRARLRDALRVVGSLLLGAPTRGQRTEVYVKDVDDGIPALERALGFDAAADTLWKELVDEATQRIEDGARRQRREQREAATRTPSRARPRRLSASAPQRAVA